LRYWRKECHLFCSRSVAKDLQVDLIVISTHNYHWFTHLMDGSDAEQVLRHGPCPILIVRKEEHDFVTTN
jgi:nucleotide-binding universal stress UspA family protein